MIWITGMQLTWFKSHPWSRLNRSLLLQSNSYAVSRLLAIWVGRVHSSRMGTWPERETASFNLSANAAICFASWICSTHGRCIAVLGPGWYKTPKYLRFQGITCPAERLIWQLWPTILPRASSATLPSATTSLGFTTSSVRLSNSEQLRISLVVGRSLLPLSSLGLQRIALVMKIAERLQHIALSSCSNRSPVRSPKSGTPVTSAPSRPGASATNITSAFQLPLWSVNTRREQPIREQIEHACASLISCA